MNKIVAGECNSIHGLIGVNKDLIVPDHILDYNERVINAVKRCRGKIRMTNSQAWDYAVGMIKVDGLEPTKEFQEYIEKEKRGEVTMADIKQYLDKKYKVKGKNVNA